LSIVQETLSIIQGTFSIIQGTFSIIQGILLCAQVGEWYSRIEDYPPVEGVKVYKSLPIWPLGLKKGLIPSKEALADEIILRKFYLSTLGVMEQVQFGCLSPEGVRRGSGGGQFFYIFIFSGVSHLTPRNSRPTTILYD
jgi:hypothetical protein